MPHTGAYWLLWFLCSVMPKRSIWRVAQFDTLRLRMVKLATSVVALKARVMLHLPSACPDKAILRLAMRARYAGAAAPAPRFHVWSGSCQPHRSTPDERRGQVGLPNPAGAEDGQVLAGRVALVVDDEPMILEILAEHCASLGMEVLEAADGTDALRLVEARPDIEVLVTDVRMPGLDGSTLAERALAMQPDIRVIFVTGYTTYRSSVWPILRKPFDLIELEAALREALSSTLANFLLR
jgi:CheY-like chemotaxis protein